MLSVVRFGRALRNRRQVVRLCEFDDRMLKDIGLTRSEVHGALAAPLRTDPSTLLLVRRVERRARARAQGPRELLQAVDAALKPA